VDWNFDGLIDLICGEYDGTIHLFINVGTTANPVLIDSGLLQLGGSDLDAGLYSVPCTVDWNKDGLLDLVVGASDGKLRYYINDGTATAPHFSTEQFVQDGGAALDVGSRSAPCFADMDNDNLVDLVAGDSGGNILFFRNQGAPGAPSYSGSDSLGVAGKPIDVSSTSRPDVADWNEDGLLDLVSGGYLSVPQLFLGSIDISMLPELGVTSFTWSIPSQGGWIDFDVTVTNPHTVPLTLDFYTSAQSADEGFWGPLMDYRNATLNPGQQIVVTLHQYVPGGAPSGAYLFTVFLGDSSTWTFTNMSYLYLWKL